MGKCLEKGPVWAGFAVTVQAVEHSEHLEFIKCFWPQVVNEELTSSSPQAVIPV